LLALAAGSPAYGAGEDEAVADSFEQAAESVSSASSAAEDVDTITVRGQRTASDAQSQAIAISSFNQSALDQLGVARVADLQGNVPSLHISKSGTATIVTIRGVGIENTNLSGEPGVLVIVDGIPIGDVSAIDGAFFDVAQVEVLRGPQGTQGSRNAAGGWIVVKSAPPDPDFSAHLDYQLGTYNQHVWRWALNVPLAGEKLMTRFSGRFEDRDGYQRAKNFFDPVNVFNFVPEAANRSDDFDSAHDLTTRFQLRSIPTEGVELRLIGNYSSQRGNGSAPFLLGEPGGGTLRFNIRFPGIRARPSDDPRWSGTNIKTPVDGQLGSVSFLGSFDIPDTILGPLEIETNFGFYRADREQALDGDATDRDARLFYFNSTTSQYSGEVAVGTVDGRPWDWRVGAFFRREERRQFGAVVTRPRSRSRRHQELISSSIAGFFEAEYWLTPRFHVLIGGRYSFDQRAATDLGGGVKVNHPSVNPVVGRLRRPLFSRPGEAFPAFTPKFLAHWQWSDSSFVALDVTAGSKAGGFFLGSRFFGEPPVYGTERLWQYQLTSKNQFFDEQLQLNVALFWTDYDPYQACFVIGIETECRTGGSATVRGIEAEMLAYPIPELAINLNFNLLDARIDSFRLVDRSEPRFVIGTSPLERNPLWGFPQDVSGNRMNKAPKYNVAVGVQYDIDLAGLGLEGAGTLTPRLQYQYQTRTYFRPWNEREYSQPTFSKVDVRLTWLSPSSRWKVEGFVNNITDVDVINFIQVGAVFDSTVFGFYQAPRTAGVRVGFDF
jgi:iron complex outermembrane receptor protein